MRRAVIGSEVGSNFTPGFGALHEMRRPPFRVRIGEPYKIVGYGALILLAVAALGHLH